MRLGSTVTAFIPRGAVRDLADAAGPPVSSWSRRGSYPEGWRHVFFGGHGPTVVGAVTSRCARNALASLVPTATPERQGPDSHHMGCSGPFSGKGS